MEFVEPDDERPGYWEPPLYRSPPPPDDRLWRHPSEMGLASGVSATERGVASNEGGASSTRSLWAVVGVSALTASVLSLGLVAAAGGLHRTNHFAQAVERQMVPRNSAVGGATAPVVDIAERVRPSVVQLRVNDVTGRASGSGVIFRSDGHILTNNHVVEGARSVKVILASGRELPARVIGTDSDTDIAVVKIDGPSFPVSTLGSAIDLKVGQTAIAIGSPLALAGGPSVTVGVVSALHREVEGQDSDRSLVDMIQTDAPIAPGSSGGALVDDGGAVIGITTAIAVSDVGAEGLGFAVPIDIARSVADQLITTGKVINVWLGVEGNDLDGTTANDLNIDGGALIGRIKVGSPAEQAGLAVRDVVVGVDGKAVGSMGALVVALRSHRPGDRVTLDVLRDSKHQQLTVTLTERPPE